MNLGEQVRYTGHPDHSAPPILTKFEGEGRGLLGRVLDGPDEDGLLGVEFAELVSEAPRIQVHRDQLEPSSTALSNDTARDVLEKAVPSFHESSSHVALRRFDWPVKGGEDVVVIVARGDATKRLVDCVREIPPFPG